MNEVVFSCDENGARFLNVAVYSLLKNYAGEEPLRINVFEGYGGHSAASKRALAEIVARFPQASVRYHDVEKAIAPYSELLKTRANSRWNVFTWAPIFVPQLLEDATGNVLHLDIDMLVVQDVSPLFKLDLSQHLIAAVAEYGQGDKIIDEAVWGKGILPRTVSRYFNTGTILFNVAACRAERTWEKLIEWYRAHYEIADRIEQDAWNALYHDRTLLLPLKWNFHDRLMKSYPSRDPSAALWQGNPPRACLEAALHPAILHFWGPKKPWKKCHRPFRRLYHAAMREIGQTPPREPLLAPYYNVVNTLTRRRIARLQTRDARAWAWRERVQRLGQLLLAPFEWLGILLGLVVFAFLNRQMLLRVCDVVSSVYYFFDREGRRHAARNLDAILSSGRVPIVCSPAARTLIIRRSYRTICRTVGHAFWTFRRAKVRVQEVGLMDEACRVFLAANRPAITVSAHLGCWEVLSQLAFLEGHTMMSVAKNIGTSGMTRLLMRSRRSIGQEIVSAEGAFKPLMAGLKDGKSLGLLVDQSVSPRKGGVWIRFFGLPIPVSAAPAFFSAKAKAPIIVAWSHPLKDGRYRCELVRTYTPEAARDVWGLTQSIAEDLARVIRRHPSCWILNYGYFDRRPQVAELATLVARETKR